MAFFTRDNARIYFEESGRGEPVVAVHGLIENTLYWEPIADKLTKNCRFIAMDMRAHGRTTVGGQPYGFDVQTIGEDIMALADHLGLKSFHILAHSTGGFAAVRTAMKDSGRFAGLILTDTGSATFPGPGDAETIQRYNDAFARSFEKYDWDQIIAGLKINPGPFFRGIMESDNAEELMGRAYEMVKCGDRTIIAAFVRSFYLDPDPHIDGLRNIHCPVLIIYGEKDDLFIESSRLMAKEIPGAQIIEYEGVGHMTSLEAPERLSRDILSFIALHPVKDV